MCCGFCVFMFPCSQFANITMITAPFSFNFFLFQKMEAIDLNDGGQNDVMDEYIEDHEVIEISEVNRGT